MSAERDFVCAARPSSSTRSPRFKSPSSMSARPTSGAAQYISCAIPCDVAHDGELLVGPLDVARRAAGEMHEHLEEQRERARLRMIERARVGDGSCTMARPVSGKPAQRGCSRQLAAAEDAGLDAGLPDPGAVERRIVHGQGLLEVLVPGFERAEVEERGPDRPFADHLQMRIAEALEERHHLLRDVMGDADLARDHVVRRHADEDGDDARRVLDLPAELTGSLVGSSDLRRRRSPCSS